MIPDWPGGLDNQEFGLLLVELHLHHALCLVAVHGCLALQVPEENLPGLGGYHGVTLLVDDGMGHDGPHLILSQGVAQRSRHVVPHSDTTPGSSHRDICFTRHAKFKYSD